MSGHQIDQRDIQLIVMLADGHSVSSAPKLLKVSQPSMSRKLRQVEDMLSYRLFIRSGCHLKGLTKEGREAIGTIKQINDLFAMLENREPIPEAPLSRHDLVKSITNDLELLSDLAAKGEENV